MASNLGRLVFLVFQFLVTNLLAMAPQPAFNGLRPKSDDLQLKARSNALSCCRLNELFPILFLQAKC